MRATFRALLIASIGIAPAVMLARAGDAPIGPPAPTTATATAPVGASPATAPARSPIQARLSRRIPELRLDSVPLGDALAAVADLTKVNLS
ncbi:MAG: hypothetical protein JWN51_3536, partial [Phycisphaerales bacterium]|nr:hypothetical protein [Phycisphaerales bacterium]